MLIWEVWKLIFCKPQKFEEKMKHVFITFKATTWSWFSFEFSLWIINDFLKYCYTTVNATQIFTPNGRRSLGGQTLTRSLIRKIRASEIGGNWVLCNKIKTSRCRVIIEMYTLRKIHLYTKIYQPLALFYWSVTNKCLLYVHLHYVTSNLTMKTGTRNGVHARCRWLKTMRSIFKLRLTHL